ncbi:hypothetical protein [Thiocystis violascens]|uniref:Uncharacterized protein n=1 Tax=Thiocystis violascens (strain ATCC 17096 / DSM 198 / 6111) TaxID=765911 RepID=I3YES7_THIV6|nr:hypothetical protein [Thiocystis violascens]AFL75495.1 hypothetical protein Thivi_3641 [Thiocystis violascens DSM 198]
MARRSENRRDRWPDPLPNRRKHFHSENDIVAAVFELGGISRRRFAILQEAGDTPDPRQQRELKRLAAREERLHQAFASLDAWDAERERIQQWLNLLAAQTKREEPESDPTERSNAPIARQAGNQGGEPR